MVAHRRSDRRRRIQLEQNRAELLNLQIDVLKIMPGRRFVSKLVNGSATIIANRGCKVGKVRQSPATIGERCIGLETQVCGGWLAVTKMRHSEDNIPEFDAVLFTGVSDGFEICPVAAANRTISISE